MFKLSSLILALLACTTLVLGANSHLKLWYDRPGTDPITTGLPIGNGRLGAIVPGAVDHENIVLNEDTMWSGGKQDANNPASYPALAEARRLLFAGDYIAARDLINKTQVCLWGPEQAERYGTYQLLGNLELDVDSSGELHGYRRELNLDEAAVRVSYNKGGLAYTREILASHPDQVIALRLRVDQAGKLGFKVRLSRPDRNEGRGVANRMKTPTGTNTQSFVSDSELLMRGRLFDGVANNGLTYAARIRVLCSTGTITRDGDFIRVTGATEAILLVSAATDYHGAIPESLSASQLEKASGVSFDQLQARHLRDYQGLFRRVRLELGGHAAGKVPTNERLTLFQAGKPDPELAEIYFQFGRYLLISSSRDKDLPANLQGIWASTVLTPWSGDYHTNINIQMNYWLAETTGLPECTQPLTKLIKDMVEPGTQTAKVHYHTRGWTVHTIHNVWGFTAPGNGASWGMFPMAGPWMVQHLWEHYAFTQNKEYLREIWPVMKGSGEFVLDWLVKHPRTHKLVSGPTNSPENSFEVAPGQSTSFCMGPSMDQQVAWDLFTNIIDAAKVLGIDDEFTRQVLSSRESLQGPSIAKDGRLMEWGEEFKEIDPHHRHTSHLFAVHPGRQINPRQHPEFAEAAKKTLLGRGDDGTGWSLAWKINFWARLYDGDHAHLLLRRLLKPLNADSTGNVLSGGGSYLNLFCAHPPFQIDGNFGATAGIAEMLLQSHAGEIHLLPALPSAWSEGSVNGLRARGGVTVAMTWKHGNIATVMLVSNQSGPAKVRFREFVVDVNFEANKAVSLKAQDFLPKR